MIGLAGGLIGGGAIVPLGPTVATDVLHGGSPAFGLLMTALGIGAATGVVTLLVVPTPAAAPGRVHARRGRDRRVDHCRRVDVVAVPRDSYSSGCSARARDAAT